MPKNLKYTLYGLLVTVLFFGLLEVIARIFGLANPSYITPPLPGEWQGLEMAHEELFWSLVPGVEKEMQNGAVAKINSLGFRGDELLPKQPDEFRILSLGGVLLSVHWSKMTKLMLHF